MIDTEVARTFDRRSALFLTAGVVLTSVLILRMLQMQVFNYREYTRKSESNLFRIRLDMAPRGRILSAKKIPISHDAKIYRIYIVPEEATDIDAVLSAAANDLKLDSRAIEKIRATIKRQPRFQPVLLSDNSDWDSLARIQARNLSGLHVSGGFNRRYEMGPAGAQIFGYVAAPKRAVAGAPFLTVGTSGMERRFEDILAGTPGRTVMITNAVGRVTGTDEEQSTPPVPGDDIHTTIHDDVQRAMFDAMASHPGCGVALDIKTGDILAMVSTPSFDPNKFNADDGDKYIAKLRRDLGKPFMNKAVEGLYPPGSTFKIVVALAALESGAINPNEKISCPGHWDYGDRRYHCWKTSGHGAMDLADALAHSCDIYFYQIALRIGIDAIREMAYKLGLGQKYIDDILSREMPGVIPDRKWKEKNIGYSWVHGDTIISGIGQGFVLTNCLQLAVCTARAVSNRRVRPRLIKNGSTPDFESLGFQQKNINAIMRGLERVTRPGGTAAAAAINVGGARMGGKTGTAQVRSISRAERDRGVLTNEQLKWYMRNHGLFVGYAPTNNPRYVVAIITEHSGGSTQAAGVAATVMKTLLNGDKK